MKYIFLLTGFLLAFFCGTGQDVLKLQSGAALTIQPGADITIFGGVSLDDGSTLRNDGTFTIKQNGASGAANFIDNSSGVSYYYGNGVFVFNSITSQALWAKNYFNQLTLNNGGLTLGTDVWANKWLLAKGVINTGTNAAVVSGTENNSFEADVSNNNFSKSWINGKLRRFVIPAGNSYFFAVGDADTTHAAEIQNLRAISPSENFPVTLDVSFGPKIGTDDGLSASENELQYKSVNSKGVWSISSVANDAAANYDLKLFTNGFAALADNGFASLQRPGGSGNAAEWSVPAASSINAVGGQGRLVSDGYALRKNLSNFGQFGIASTLAAGGGTGLQGVYYSGKDLSRTPLLTRIDPTINFELTYAHQPMSPAPGIVSENNFSVRWTGSVLAQYSEPYTFYTLSDDGIRLWVNGQLLVDNWVNQGATERSGSIALEAGQKYNIVIEYYEETGDAVAKLYWSSSSTAKQIVPQAQLYPTTVAITGGTGLQAVYYNGTEYAGTPLLTRIDPGINLELTYAHQPLSPAPGIVPEDNFSVRWTGQVQAQFSETYTFYTLSDDGIRLWVNGVKLVDNFVNQSATEKSGSITLAAGQKYNIVAEYYEATGEAVAKLYWSSASTAKQIVPQLHLYPETGPANGVPSCATNISPANGAIVIPTAFGVTLGWHTVAGATNYYVYMGTASGPTIQLPGPVSIGANLATYTLNNILPNTTYYWYVVPVNDLLQANGCGTTNVTSFTTSGLTGSVGTGTGLRSEYFNGTAFAGTPLLTRIDPGINLELTYAQQPLSPAPGIVPEDNFSARWTGQVQAQFSETYTFYTLSDDGIRLWVNGVKLVDNFVNQGATEKSGSITLDAGQKYDIVAEYYEATGEAVAKLYWSSASTAKQIVPQLQLYPPAAAARVMGITPAVKSAAEPISTIFAATINPNPVKSGSHARLQINSNKIATAMINTISVDGVNVSSRSINLQQGANALLLSTVGLAKGLYFVQVSGTGRLVTLKLIVE